MSRAALIAASSGSLPLPRLLTKAKIVEFQRMLEAMAVECPEDSFGDDEMVEHVIAPGLYARALFIPAGTVLVGKAHRTEHLCVMLYGHMSVATDAGPIEVRGPWITMTTPGIKRVGFAFEDSMWVTFHPTSLTDVEEIMETIVMPEHEYLALANEEAAKLELQGSSE